MKFKYLLLTIFCWGATYFLQKVVVDRIKNFILVQVSYAIMMALFSIVPLLYFQFKCEVVLDRLSFLLLIVMALTAVIGNFSFFYSLQNNVNSATYIAASNSYVILVFIYSVIFLSEQITFSKILGLLFMFFGVVLLLIK